MIVCKELDKSFEDKQAMFTALRENKSTLIAQKKMMTKECDSVSFIHKVESNKGEVVKSDTINLDGVNTLKMDLVINTTKVMDSHSDVHLDGIWNKSVKEQKNLYLLQEHKMTFANIITDKVKASVKSLDWSELGATFEGKTQALIFTSEVHKDRNGFMFEQYAKGFVKNHSVGMRYVKLELALNSESKYDKEEKEVWDKYIGEVANKSDAEKQGYFWAVSEAKIIEGSAVPIGSNKITPVLSIEEKAVNDDTLNNEPSKDTQNISTAKEGGDFNHFNYL